MPREQVVDAEDLVTERYEAVAEMRTDKPRASCDHGPHEMRLSV
jgi:hypothetical protein